VAHTKQSSAERTKRLAEVADLAAGVRFGWQGYADRLDEWGAGYRSSTRLGESSHSGGISDPTATRVVRSVEYSGPDPARCSISGFDDRLRTAHVALLALYDAYASVAQPRLGADRQADPGCELCTEAGGYSHTYSTPKIGTPPKPKRLCSWCYPFVRRHGRLPTRAEVTAHAEGRRVRVKA